MKIIHTSDLHIGKRLNQISLIEEQRTYLSQILQILAKTNADLLVIAGDIYDKYLPPTEAVKILDDFFYSVTVESKIPIVAISGNHDSKERLAFAARILKYNSLYIFTTPSEQVIRFQDEWGEVNFYPMPFVDPISARVMLSDDSIKNSNDAFPRLFSHFYPKFNSSKRNVLIAHDHFVPASESEADSNMTYSDSERMIGGSFPISSSFMEKFDYVALGHLHAPQSVGRNEHIRYSGSPYKFSISEVEHCKSVTFIEIERKGSMKIELIPLNPIRDLIKITDDFTSLRSGKYGEVLDYVHINLTDSIIIPNAFDVLLEKFSNLIGISYENEGNSVGIRLRDRLLTNSGELSIRENFINFYKQVTDCELDEYELLIFDELISSMESIVW